MHKELCIQAFENACGAKAAIGMIFQNDRGSQFTGYAFRESLARYDGACAENERYRGCYDNARMESFFATLKKEKLYRLRTERYSMAYMKMDLPVCDDLLQQAADLHAQSGRMVAGGIQGEVAATSSIAEARQSLGCLQTALFLTTPPTQDLNATLPYNLARGFIML